MNILPNPDEDLRKRIYLPRHGRRTPKTSK